MVSNGKCFTYSTINLTGVVLLCHDCVDRLITILSFIFNNNKTTLIPRDLSCSSDSHQFCHDHSKCVWKEMRRIKHEIFMFVHLLSFFFFFSEREISDF